MIINISTLFLSSIETDDALSRIQVTRAFLTIFSVHMKLLPHFLLFALPRQGTHRYPSHHHTFALLKSYKELECIRLAPPFDRELHNFYGEHFSPRRNKRLVPSLPKDDTLDDAVYVLRRETDNHSLSEIVAALRLTRSKCDKNYAFLRSLCCAREYRRQGLAMHLLQSSLEKFTATSSYCFASSDLTQFYEKAGFEKIRTEKCGVPKWMMHSYRLMAHKWSIMGKSLELFVKGPVQKTPVQMILLQHSEEAPKSTATGWLADDKSYNHSIADLQSSIVSLDQHVQVSRWIWSGRKDTCTIERRVQELAAESPIFLLWTGQNSSTTSDIESDATYIILDGTWQQAQTMYRKIPALWKLPRVLLTDTQQSKYTLRKDYTGWREKFSLNEDGGDLLCTAEVMAAVLDRRGDFVGASEIRDRLDLFQRHYPQIAAKRNEQTTDSVHT